MPRGMGRGRGAVEKPKDFGGVMKKLVKFCSRYIPVMIFALVLGAAGTVCQIIGPDKLKDMTNEITKGLPAMVHGKPVMNSIDMDAVSRIAWLLVALYVGYALLSYLQSWLMANVTQRTAQQLREAISQKINRLPLKYFDKVSYGDVLSRITNDVDAIGQTLGQSVGSLITSITLFFGALIMMFYNNVTMTLCAIGSALLGLIIMGVIMKVSQKYFTRQQVALGDVNGHVEEMYTGHTVVKAFCGEERSIEQFEKYNNDLYVSGWKSQFLSGLMQLVYAIDKRRLQAAEAEIVLAVKPRPGQLERVRVTLPGQLIQQRTAGIGDRQHARRLIKRFARSVVQRVSQQAVLAVIRHFHHVRMSAACNQADKRRFQLLMRNIVCTDMPFDMVDGNQRQVCPVCQRLGAADANQQRAN